jgi:hypothetical protein
MARINEKKIPYKVPPILHTYLKTYNRELKLPIEYSDLIRYEYRNTLYDKHGEDTLWVSCQYSQDDLDHINNSLKEIYAILKAGGDTTVQKHLFIDRIDLCLYGNTNPFRVRIVNNINDNFDYFYIKNADASRIYGLELEHLLSPNSISYVVDRHTLIEEHIAGIPGDVFIKEMLPVFTEPEKAQIAKEFVKFNERCMIRLLGDMRSYNYVIVPTHDFDQVVYKIRAIDFDQQSFEGKLKVYNLQYFKENFKMVDMVGNKLQSTSIEQYKVEERSIIAKRMISSYDRITELIDCMKADTISYDKNIELLKNEVCNFTNDIAFKKCKNMGEILETILIFVKRNYLDVSAV